MKSELVKPTKECEHFNTKKYGILLFIEDSFEDGRFEIAQTVSSLWTTFSCAHFVTSQLPVLRNNNTHTHRHTGHLNLNCFLSNRDTAEEIRKHFVSLETES